MTAGNPVASETAAYLDLGPIARILVKRALDVASSADDFCQRLGAHIERDRDRQAFLRKMQP